MLVSMKGVNKNKYNENRCLEKFNVKDSVRKMKTIILINFFFFLSFLSISLEMLRVNLLDALQCNKSVFYNV